VKLRGDLGVRDAKAARTRSYSGARRKYYVDRSERHILGNETESGEKTPKTTSPKGADGIGRLTHSHTVGSPYYPYCLS